jgi:predicted nucleic acid-binding protein
VIEPVLLDTGPLVAILYKKDSLHSRCVAEFKNIKYPPVTCWPVVAEAAHLLRRVGGHVEDILRMISCGELVVRHLGVDSANWMTTFIARYRNVDVDLADAAMMYLAEKEAIEVVLTLDRRHFSIYRLQDGRAVSVLPTHQS